MIKEITKYIGAQVASLSTSGTSRNLFMGRRPDLPVISTVVEEPIPDPTENVYGRNSSTDVIIGKQVKKTFRIVCRGAINDYFSARDVAESIHTALHGDFQIELQIGSGTKYLVNIEATEPASIGPDDKHRPEVVLYLYCNTEEIP